MPSSLQGNLPVTRGQSLFRFLTHGESGEKVSLILMYR